ncbi:hypothetical protein [Silvanigrella aquatica]|uniref:Autotransporter domain-containing protein n=1 Tax=Silvanigrella aquatica TaxID=1915309 RepID=A0A1L4CY56_9BACT|nr:hypothetical protein [Silvanigrella aquatica]APJ02874.1 hypothetical protein AXG55_02635 [Silvanigrella aquatica]
MKRFQFSNYFNFALLISSFPLSSYAQNDQRPVYTPAQDYSEGISPFMNTAGKSLSAQRLSPSAFPEEAEIFCNYDNCILGLTKGLVIGGDVFGMAYAPLRQYMDPNWNSGTLYVLDVFGGFQILRDLEQKIFMNAQIGYRRINFNNNGITISNQGFTTSVNYSQSITPIYSQGISFSGYFAGNSNTNDQIDIANGTPNHGTFSDNTSYFYRISQKYPTYQFSLPADLELANWSSQQTGLAAPIRAYAHLEPFYVQNNISFNYNNVSLQKTEQNFGIRIAANGSYESSSGTSSGRFALLGSLGLDFSTSSVSTTQSGNADASVPQRRWLVPYVNVGGSWQF